VLKKVGLILNRTRFKKMLKLILHLEAEIALTQTL